MKDDNEKDKVTDWAHTVLSYIALMLVAYLVLSAFKE